MTLLRMWNMGSCRLTMVGIVVSLMFGILPGVARGRPLKDIRQTPHKSPLISFWNVGGGRFGKTHYRAPGYMSGQPNWKTFIKKKIIPEYKYGVRRWFIHNPFGVRQKGPMRFDQYLDAKKHGFGYLTKDFVSAWRNFIKNHPDVEVIGYLGDLPYLAKQYSYPKEAGHFIKRAMKSVEPILKAGMSVGVDSASRSKKNGPTRRFIQLLSSMDVPVYIESWPSVKNPYMADFNIVCAENRIGHFVGVRGRGVPANRIKGEIIWLVNANLSGNKKLRNAHTLARHLYDWITRGYTVAAPIRKVIHQTKTSLGEIIPPKHRAQR